MRRALSHSTQQFNLNLTEAQLNDFELYSSELIAWNRRTNLTRITDPEEIVVKHFLDSLSVCQALCSAVVSEDTDPSDITFSMVDVGSGAGFPGLPLKIALPNIQLTLLDSTAKKTAFLQHIVETLRLTGVTVLTARAEEVGHQVAHREQYDVVVARAVSTLSVLAEYTLPLVKVGGLVIAQKGQSPTEEIEAAVNALDTLGGKVSQVTPVEIPGLKEVRHLVVIQKIKPTPPNYPRRPGMPVKRPL